MDEERATTPLRPSELDFLDELAADPRFVSRETRDPAKVRRFAAELAYRAGAAAGAAQAEQDLSTLRSLLERVCSRASGNAGLRRGDPLIAEIQNALGTGKTGLQH